MEGEKSLIILLIIVVLKRSISSKINYFRIVLIFFSNYFGFSVFVDKIQNSPF